MALFFEFDPSSLLLHQGILDFCSDDRILWYLGLVSSPFPLFFLSARRSGPMLVGVVLTRSFVVFNVAPGVYLLQAECQKCDNCRGPRNSTFHRFSCFVYIWSFMKTFQYRIPILF